MLYERKNFEKMTNRKYEYLKGFNGHFEIALYVDTYEEVDSQYAKVIEKGEPLFMRLNIEEEVEYIKNGMAGK